MTAASSVRPEPVEGPARFRLDASLRSALAELLVQAALWRRLVGAYARSEMQYRVSFFLRMLGTFCVTIIDFAGIAVVLSRVPHLAGWTLPEIALLYGMSAVCFSLAEMFAGSLDFFDELIVAGTFDRLLIRPLGVLLQTTAEGFSLRRLGRASQGAVVMLIGFGTLQVDWTIPKVLVLATGVLSGIAIFFSIFVISAVFCFWTVQGKEATHVVTYGGDFMSSYPLDLFHGWLRRFATFVIPLAFVNYYPVLFVLDRPDPLGLPDWVRLISPLVAIAIALVARRAWAAGVRQYQSTGT